MTKQEWEATAEAYKVAKTKFDEYWDAKEQEIRNPVLEALNQIKTAKEPFETERIARKQDFDKRAKPFKQAPEGTAERKKAQARFDAISLNARRKEVLQRQGHGYPPVDPEEEVKRAMKEFEADERRKKVEFEKLKKTYYDQLADIATREKAFIKKLRESLDLSQLTKREKDELSVFWREKIKAQNELKDHHKIGFFTSQSQYDEEDEFDI